MDRIETCNISLLTKLDLRKPELFCNRPCCVSKQTELKEYNRVQSFVLTQLISFRSVISDKQCIHVDVADTQPL
jgi:hypothetical protein